MAQAEAKQEAKQAGNEAGATLAPRQFETGGVGRPNGPANWTSHAFVPKHLCNWRQAPVSKVRGQDVVMLTRHARSLGMAFPLGKSGHGLRVLFAVGGHDERAAAGATATVFPGWNSQVRSHRCMMSRALMPLLSLAAERPFRPARIG
jgi:hypothetical protein